MSELIEKLEHDIEEHKEKHEERREEREKARAAHDKEIEKGKKMFEHESAAERENLNALIDEDLVTSE